MLVSSQRGKTSCRITARRSNAQTRRQMNDDKSDHVATPLPGLSPAPCTRADAQPLRLNFISTNADIIIVFLSHHAITCCTLTCIKIRTRNLSQISFDSVSERSGGCALDTAPDPIQHIRSALSHRQSPAGCLAGAALTNFRFCFPFVRTISGAMTDTLARYRQRKQFGLLMRLRIS